MAEYGVWVKWSADNDPDFNERVVIWTRFLKLEVAFRNWEQGRKPEHWKISGGGRLELDDVTHWMRIQPPMERISDCPARVDGTAVWSEETPNHWVLKLPIEGKNIIARVEPHGIEKWFYEYWPWLGQWGTARTLEEAKKLAGSCWQR